MTLNDAVIPTNGEVVDELSLKGESLVQVSQYVVTAVIGWGRWSTRTESRYPASMPVGIREMLRQ